MSQNKTVQDGNCLVLGILFHLQETEFQNEMFPIYCRS